MGDEEICVVNSISGFGPVSSYRFGWNAIADIRLGHPGIRGMNGQPFEVDANAKEDQWPVQDGMS